MPLPPERVVLELVGEQTVEAELLVALRDAAEAGFQIALVALRDAAEAGFQIALDDFRLSAESERLLELADAVKLDIRELDGRTLIRHLARLRDCGLAGGVARLLDVARVVEDDEAPAGEPV